MTRALRGAACAVAHLLGLAVCSVLVLAVSYVLSWRLLVGDAAGSDLPFHLDLARWVDSTFPAIGWWYPWDANGIPYREGYPLAAHWTAVAVARAAHLTVADGLQVVEFLVSPLCALGVYAYVAWRLRRPVAGLVAALLYLLSPMAWTLLADWGFYANQAGTVLFMPALIAIDACFARWLAGDRGWRFRLAALTAAALTALLGLVSPAIVGAPLLAIPAYAAAVPPEFGRARLRWLLTVSPLLMAAGVLLAAFWALPLRDYLAVVGSRQPPRTFSPSLYPLESVGQVLSLHGLDPRQVLDRGSLSPAVWVPALAGVLAGAGRRERVLAVLAAAGLLMMTAPWLYAVVFGVPVLSNLVSPRVGMLYLQFGAPVLAALGLVSLAPELATSRLRHLGAPAALRAPVAAVLVLAGLTVGAAAVSAGALRVQGHAQQLAYGPFPTDVRDLWLRHRDDVCATGLSPAPCASAVLPLRFNVSELTDACRLPDGRPRQDLELCRAIARAADGAWDPSDDALVESTLAGCRSRPDPVCAAAYLPLADQVDPGRWRPARFGCVTAGCGARADEWERSGRAFAAAPDRAVLDAHSDLLLKAFHDVTDGGQSYGYNFQLLPSPELDAFALDTMLGPAPAAAKGQAAARLGADAVVLGRTQTGQAAAYDRLGWRRESAQPAVYAPPDPAPLAAEWPRGNAVLVIGSAQDGAAHPYNPVYERAVSGMVPDTSAWFVRAESPAIDDHSDEELARYPALLLLGYRYHDARTAWDRLDRYVRAGGRLYVETGWQYVDPDWDQGSAPAALPVTNLRWGPVDAAGPLRVEGRPAPDWGAMTSGEGAWGASTAATVRPGAEALATAGGRALAARWTLGRGRVLWSGMNLMAHADASHSAAEDAFLARQWAWLLAQPAPAAALSPAWSGGERATLRLQESREPVFVLFRESAAPGWSAELRWPGGGRAVPIEQAEMDFMLVRLDGVPAGAELVFRYGPTWRVRAWWALSLLTLAGLLSWVVRPAPFERAYRLAGSAGVGAAARLREWVRRQVDHREDW